MNKLIEYLVSAFIGIIVGFVGGLQGIAGGFYISMFLLASGIASTQRQAAGTTLLAIVFPISIGAVFDYYKTGDIFIPHAMIIALFYTIAATYGARFGDHIKDEWLYLSLGLLLFLTSFYFLNKFYIVYKKK